MRSEDRRGRPSRTTTGLTPRGLDWRTLGVAAGAWLAVLYFGTLHPFAVRTPEVVCALPSGQVWLFAPSEGAWAVSRHRLGSGALRAAVPDAVPPDRLACDPARIRPEALASLVGEAVAAVELECASDCSLVVQEELFGRFTYRYTFSSDRVERLSGTRTFFGFPMWMLLSGGGFGVVLVFVGCIASVRPRPRSPDGRR